MNLSAARSWVTLALLVASLPRPTSAQISFTGQVGSENPISSPVWDAGDYLVVGVSESGSLTLNAGSVVTSDFTTLGQGSGSTGQIDVNGGTLNAGPALFVGGQGNGTLIVRNGGVAAVDWQSSYAATPDYESGLVAVPGAERSASVQVSGGTLVTGEVFKLDGTNGGDVTLEISGTGIVNSYHVEVDAGHADVSGGTWNIAESMRLGRYSLASRLDVRGTGSVVIAGDLDTLGPVAVADSGFLSARNLNLASLQISGNGAVEANAVIVSSGNITVSDSASLTTGNLSFYRSFDIDGGTLELGNLEVGYSSSRTTTMTIDAGEVTASVVSFNLGSTGSQATLQLNGGSLTADYFSATWDRAVSIRLNGGTLRLGLNRSEYFYYFVQTDQQVTIESGGGTIDTQAFNGGTSHGLDGTGRLTKIGSGTFTLKGANTYAGGTTVSAGTLAITGSVYHPAASIAVAGADTPLLTLSGSGALTSSLGIIGNGEARISGGTWTNSGALLVGYAGPGTLAISGGTVTTASLTAAGLSPGSATITLSGGTLATGQVAKTNSPAATFTFDGGKLRLTDTQSSLFSGFSPGSVTLGAGGGTIDTQTYSITNVAAMSGTGKLTKQGTGTLTLTGDNTYTGGTLISGGTLTLGSGGTTGSILGDVVNNGSLFINRSDSYTLAGTVSGSGALFLTNASGRTILTADNTYTGYTAVFNGGTLQLGDGGASGSVVGDLYLNAGFAGGTNYSALVVNRSGNLTLAGTINGGGSVTQMGTGTLTLTGANTYTGATNIQSGKLVVNGSLAHTAVTIADGAALGGSGSIGGSTTLLSGATLAPGNSPGTLTFTDGLTLNAGSILDFELGTTSDLIVVSGGVLTGPASGTVTLDLSDSGDFAAGTYTLFDFSSGVTLSDFDIADFIFGSTVAGYDYSLAFAGSTLQLTATTSAVPEPSTYAALAGLAALGTAFCRRRRRDTRKSPPSRSAFRRKWPM